MNVSLSSSMGEEGKKDSKVSPVGKDQENAVKKDNYRSTLYFQNVVKPFLEEKVYTNPKGEISLCAEAKNGKLEDTPYALKLDRFALQDGLILFTHSEEDKRIKTFASRVNFIGKGGYKPEFCFSIKEGKDSCYMTEAHKLSKAFEEDNARPQLHIATYVDLQVPKIKGVPLQDKDVLEGKLAAIAIIDTKDLMPILNDALAKKGESCNPNGSWKRKRINNADNILIPFDYLKKHVKSFKIYEPSSNEAQSQVQTLEKAKEGEAQTNNQNQTKTQDHVQTNQTPLKTNVQTTTKNSFVPKISKGALTIDEFYDWDIFCRRKPTPETLPLL